MKLSSRQQPERRHDESMIMLHNTLGPSVSKRLQEQPCDQSATVFMCLANSSFTSIDRVDNCHALINQNSTKHRRCHPFFLGSSAPHVAGWSSSASALELVFIYASATFRGGSWYVFSARRLGFGWHSDVAVTWSCPRRSRAAPARPCRDRGVLRTLFTCMVCQQD